MANTSTHFNYYLVCHRKLWLYAGVRIVNRLRLVISYLTALNKQKMTMFYQYNVPGGTTKMIRYMNGQFFDEGILFSSYCDAEIFGIACPVRDRIPVEKMM